MSYHIYQTDGVVLRAHPIGEADLLIDVFTRELGLVKAKVKSARTAHSKLRYGTQTYARGQFAFVRGKESWRVTGVCTQENAYYAFKHAYGAQVVALRIYALLARLIHGEQPHPNLYDAVADGIAFLRAHTDDAAAIRNTECLTVLRILYHLGYVGDHPGLSQLLSVIHMTETDVAAIGPIRREAVQTINASLKETQL